MGLQFGSTSLADVDTSDGLGFKLDEVSNFAIDQAEQDAAAPYLSTPGVPYWEDLIRYGAGRWIDNGFSARPRIGNYETGSGAGNSGRTYTHQAGYGGAAPVASGISPLLLIGGAVLLGFALLRT